MRIKGKKLISYRCHTINNKSWDNILYNDRSDKNNLKLKFHTGKGSVLYYSGTFSKTKELFFNENLFIELCPMGDDVWFNILRECNNIDVFYKKSNYMIKNNTNKNSGLYINYNSKKK